MRFYPTSLFWETPTERVKRWRRLIQFRRLTSRRSPLAWIVLFSTQSHQSFSTRSQNENQGKKLRTKSYLASSSSIWNTILLHRMHRCLQSAPKQNQNIDSIVSHSLPFHFNPIDWVSFKQRFHFPSKILFFAPEKTIWQMQEIHIIETCLLAPSIELKSLTSFRFSSFFSSLLFSAGASDTIANAAELTMGLLVRSALIQFFCSTLTLRHVCEGFEWAFREEALSVLSTNNQTA